MKQMCFLIPLAASVLLPPGKPGHEEPCLMRPSALKRIPAHQHRHTLVTIHKSISFSLSFPNLYIFLIPRTTQCLISHFPATDTQMNDKQKLSACLIILLIQKPLVPLCKFLSVRVPSCIMHFIIFRSQLRAFPRSCSSSIQQSRSVSSGPDAAGVNQGECC